MNSQMSFKEASQLILEGNSLMVAGERSLLEKLPKGKWIGGSSPYFIGNKDDAGSMEELQVLCLPNFIESSKIEFYTIENLNQIPKDYESNGISFIVIPAESKVHQKFAEEALHYDGLFDRPLVGWVTGVQQEKIGKVRPVVVNGLTAEVSSDKILVMHIQLPKNKIGKLDIINLFRPAGGDIISFPETGFDVNSCLINGVKENFVDYIVKNKLDIKLPLVANYNGAMVNVSFQKVDYEKKQVHFYAPVFKGVEYSVPFPIEDYEKEFEAELAKHKIKPTFTCNCILNFLYANLEGKKSGEIMITFGEIAYILLNQTMVYLTIVDKD